MRLNLDDIDDLLGNLTPGPWFVEDCEDELNIWNENVLLNVERDEDDEITSWRNPSSWHNVDRVAAWELIDDGEDCEDNAIMRANADFIAKCRTIVPAMLSELYMLRGIINSIPGMQKLLAESE